MQSENEPSEPINLPELHSIVSGGRKDRRVLIISISLLLPGIALALEGFYFADGSGLLFGQFRCFGGCQTVYQSLIPIFWRGIYLLVLGLSSIIAGSLLFLKVRRNKGEVKASIFETQTQKRLIIASTLLVLVLTFAFLAPILPFSTALASGQPQPSFPRVDVCYQTVSFVYSPVYNYHGLESISQALFHVGNFVYYQCTVISGSQ